MGFQIKDLEDVAQEPVTLDEVKDYSGIDCYYAAEDKELGALITVARQRLEAFLNVGLARRKVQLQWNGELVELPLSPTGALVSLKDQDGAALDPDEYVLSKYDAATLEVKAVSDSDFRYWYSLTGIVQITPIHNHLCERMYTAVYETGYEKLPKSLRHALLAEVDFLEKLKGQPDPDEISPGAFMLSKSYSRNLVI
jgi:hypothetical protein